MRGSLASWLFYRSSASSLVSSCDCKHGVRLHYSLVSTDSILVPHGSSDFTPSPLNSSDEDRIRVPSAPRSLENSASAGLPQTLSHVYTCALGGQETSSQGSHLDRRVVPFAYEVSKSNPSSWAASCGIEPIIRILDASSSSHRRLAWKGISKSWARTYMGSPEKVDVYAEEQGMSIFIRFPQNSRFPRAQYLWGPQVSSSHFSGFHKRYTSTFNIENEDGIQADGPERLTGYGEQLQSVIGHSEIQADANCGEGLTPIPPAKTQADDIRADRDGSAERSGELLLAVPAPETEVADTSVESSRRMAKKQPPKGFGAAAVVWSIMTELTSKPWGPSTVEALDKMQLHLKNHHVSQVVRSLRDADVALEFFNWTKTKNGYKHDALNYNMMIGKLANARKLENVLPMLEEMHEQGWTLNFNTLTTIISNYDRGDKIPEVLGIVDNAGRYGVQPNVGAYTCLIDVLAKRGDFDRATKYYSLMLESGCKLDLTAYNVLMRAFGRAKDVEKVCALFQNMKEDGHKPDKYTYGFLVGSLARAGRIDEALTNFKDMKESGYTPDVPSYNILIDCLGKGGKVDEACELVDELHEMGHEPDVVTYNTIFDCLGKAGKVNDVYTRYKDMRVRNIIPDAFTCSILVDTLAKAGRMEKACDLFLEMSRTPEFKFDVIMYNSMLHRLGKAGRIDQLFRLFNEMKEAQQPPDQFSFNIVIDALCKGQEYQRAHQVMYEMKNLGFQPDVVTYNNLIHSFGKAGKVARASKYFKEMLKAGLVPDHISYNIMINILGKARKSDKALKVLKDMKKRGMIPDGITYNRLIDTFGKAGDSKAASLLFREMQETGISPDVITYTVLINALANDGKMDSAKKVYRDMRDKGHQPDVVTFNCLISGYVREGRINEANELLIRMKGSHCKPTASTYGILIDANARHRNDDIVQKLRKERNEAGLLPEVYR